MSKKEYATFREWLLNTYSHDELIELYLYGAEYGFPGLTYHSQTSALYRKYHKDIWKILDKYRKRFDLNSILELIASLKGAKDVESDVQYKNLLVWHVAEKIAYETIRGQRRDDD